MSRVEEPSASDASPVGLPAYRRTFGQLNDPVKLWLSRSGVLPLSISISRSYTAGQPLSPHDLPTLESIGVEGLRSHDADDVDWRLVSFMRTTSLHSVSLMQVVDPFRFLLSWEQLYHLSLGHIGEMGDFFGNLVRPNLRTLEYASIHDNNPLPFTSLLHSSNSVQRLSLNMLLMTDILIDCLRLVPMLHELYIHGEPLDPAEGSKIRMLPYAPNSATYVSLIFTLLQTLHARSASRHGNHAPLSSVDVKFGRPMQVDIRTPLARLIGDGLKLTLRYDDDSSVVYSPSERNQSHRAEWEPISEMWNTRTW
ncbi:hypothetical protein C8R44DRAFT_933929 [Mycena epipterygia]|nr:hypothetical protein C8R44DRAFT_933929 [Mycena epipterygia]